jgi:hypothetical protein
MQPVFCSNLGTTQAPQRYGDNTLSAMARIKQLLDLALVAVPGMETLT